MQKCLLSSSVFSLSAPPLPSSPSASPACTLLLQPPIYARKTTVACRVALDTVCSKEGSGSGEGVRRPARRPPFEQRCRQLEAYIQQHGHSRVPVSEPSGEEHPVQLVRLLARTPCQQRDVQCTHPPTDLLQAWADGQRSSGTPGRRAGCWRPGSSG